MLEVPSGVWADLLDRRLLLGAGAVLQAMSFATWMLWPSYLGFAAGFLLWSLASALQSGTFEALVYDELAARGATPSYARLIGEAQAVAMVVMTAAIALGAPLYELGGYPLVGWSSAAIALLGVAAAVALPAARPVVVVEDVAATEVGGGLAHRYLAMLRAGLREAVRVVPVRRLLALLFVVVVVVAVDEYFPLLVSENGIDTRHVPLLIAAGSLLQAAGTATVRWTAHWPRRRFATLVACGSALVAVGVGLGEPWALLLVGIGYGLLNSAMVATETRLQDAIVGSARATVTSAAGLVKEGAAMVGVTLIAVGGGTSVGVPMVLVALIAGAVASVAAWRAADREPSRP